MIRILGKASIYLSHFVAGGLALYNFIATLVALVELIGALFALLGSHSEQDINHTSILAQHFILTAAGVLMLWLDSWVLSQRSKHFTTFAFLLGGVIIGGIAAGGGIAWLSTHWSSLIVSGSGIGIAIALFVIGFFAIDMN